jgi:hypothetical protein
LKEDSKTEWDSYDIGTTFDKIFLDKTSSFSLKNIYDYLFDKDKGFFSNAHFIRMSAEQPTSENVKVWFDTSEQE